MTVIDNKYMICRYRQQVYDNRYMTVTDNRYDNSYMTVIDNRYMTIAL